MVTQQTKAEYWEWGESDLAERLTEDGITVSNRLGLSSDEAIALIEGGTAEELAGYIVERLEHVGDFFGDTNHDRKYPGSKVRAAYAIMHDKDSYCVWNEDHQIDEEVLKERHIHILILFAIEKQGGRSIPVSGTIQYLAERIGVPEANLEKPKRGGNPATYPELGGVSQSFDNQMAYLIHIKYKDKWQYAPNEVATIRGPAYKDVFAHRRNDWLKGRAHIAKKKAAEDIEDLVEKCISGHITKESIDLSDDLLAIYGRHKRKVDDALKVWQEAQQARHQVEVRRTLGTEWTKTAVLMTGPRRAGKDTLAKKFLTELQGLAAMAGRQWKIAKPGGKHALESVGDADLVHHDDARYYMVPAYDTMLRYLDPHQVTEAEARYYNRKAPAPRVAVLSTSNSLYEFGLTTLARKSTQELEEAAHKGPRRTADIDEFLLRLGWVVEVTAPKFTVDDLLDQGYDKNKAFAEFCSEVTVGFYKPKERGFRRTEAVETRTGSTLGQITTQADLSPIGILKGVDRAARFLAVEVLHERNRDIVSSMSIEVAEELAAERGTISAHLEKRQIEQRNRHTQWIQSVSQDYVSVYRRVYPSMTAEVPEQGPRETDGIYLSRLRGLVNDLLRLEVSQRSQRANAPLGATH